MCKHLSYQTQGYPKKSIIIYFLYGFFKFLLQLECNAELQKLFKNNYEKSDTILQKGPLRLLVLFDSKYHAIIIHEVIILFAIKVPQTISFSAPTRLY